MIASVNGKVLDLMPIFKDAANRSWPVSICVDSLRRVRAATGLLLTDLPPETVDKLRTDPLLMGDVLWAIIEPDAIKQTIDKASFEAALYGDAYEAALVALNDALLEFFPKSARAKILAAIEAERTAASAAASAENAAVGSVQIAPGDESAHPAASGNTSTS